MPMQRRQATHSSAWTFLKAMWGLKDAPRAFGMRLSRSLKEIGYHQWITDKQIWRKFKKDAEPVDEDHCRYNPHL
eukprot:8744477-Prorocentrum_lima.AAC.1